MKKIITALVVILAVTGGYFGFPQYEQYKFIKPVYPHIKKTSLLVTRTVQYETDDTRITYKELLEKLESDISEIDKIILEVQTLAASNNKISDSVLVYLKKSQNLLRVLKEKHQNVLASNIDQNYLDRIVNEDVSRSIKIKAIVDATVSSGKVIAFRPEVVKAANNLKDARKNTAAYLQSDALVDPIILDALIKNHEG